ncbi:MAG: bifunctional pyr operon transcriptional regulator/uracil phosphoribosyltransferase PyrR [Chitinophagales bacterium]|nr:bifunctional pyr operon transcriptional regulator/uracil phosphoribosyltransferase PyrR [Chitinophagales bacterium]
MSSQLLLNNTQIHLMLQRLSREVLENYLNEEIFLIGIQPRGILLSEKIYTILQSISKNKVYHGSIDDTFHRDDFRRGKIVTANTTNISFEIEDKKIILVDDVLYTGRTVRAAMGALLMYGRPKKIELLTLIDRRFKRELPIQPDYVGQSVDTIENIQVKVDWNNKNNKVVFVN